MTGRLLVAVAAALAVATEAAPGVYRAAAVAVTANGGPLVVV